MDRLDQIDQSVMEAELGEVVPTETTSDREIFQEMQREFERVQPIKELKQHIGFHALYRQACVEAEYAAKRNRDYRGTDAVKAADLQYKMRLADAIRDWLRTAVEAADQTPRPVMVKNEHRLG